MTDIASRFGPHLVLGIGILLFGVVLLLDRLGYVPATSLLKFWPVLLILLGASVIAQAFFGVGETSQRHRPAIGFPLLLLLVILGVLTMRDAPGIVRAGDGDRVTVFAVMSGNAHTSPAAPFRRAEMTSVMGEARLDLREATLAPGEEAVVDVFTLMGGAVIYVPEGWTVDVQTMPVMGGVRDRRWRPSSATATDESAADQGPAADTGEARGVTPPAGAAQAQPTGPGKDVAAAPSGTAPAPRVVIRGFIMMGGLTVRS
jgi:hypothetical protein